jgi:imidazolonepropionase-like amidohydrolase
MRCRIGTCAVCRAGRGKKHGRKPRRAPRFLVATAFLFAGSAIGSPAPAISATSFLIQDVRLFDGHRVIDHRSVLVRDGRIAAIGGPDLPSNGATIVPGAGKTLLPGIIDAHVHVPHVNTRNALIQSARLGVTTVLDMFTDQGTLRTIRQIEAEDAPGMADVRSAGVGATATGGHPTQMGGPAIPTIDSPDQAEAFVAARAAEGSDYIKLILEDSSEWPGVRPLPTLSPATFRAIVAAAHRHGKLAVVHVFTEANARMAIEAGVDGLVHLFLGEHASPDFGRFAAEHHIFVVPTLNIEYLQCGKSNGSALAADARLTSQTFPEYVRSLAMPHSRSPVSCDGTDEAIRQLHAAGVPLLTGTDAPVPGGTYGASALDEMALLVGDGLTPIEALIAGTSAPARAFRLNDRGEIRVGKRADLLLVDGDPTRNIDAVKNISAVWKRGALISRLPVAASTSPS